MQANEYTIIPYSLSAIKQRRLILVARFIYFIYSWYSVSHSVNIRFFMKRIRFGLFTHGAFSDINKLHQVQCRCEKQQQQLKLILSGNEKRARNLFFFRLVVICRLVVSRHWKCIQYLVHSVSCFLAINNKTCKWKVEHCSNWSYIFIHFMNSQFVVSCFWPKKTINSYIVCVRVTECDGLKAMIHRKTQSFRNSIWSIEFTMCTFDKKHFISLESDRTIAWHCRFNFGALPYREMCEFVSNIQNAQCSHWKITNGNNHFKFSLEKQTKQMNFLSVKFSFAWTTGIISLVLLNLE